MKHYRKELIPHAPSRRAFVNITPRVEQALAASGVKNGRYGVRRPVPSAPNIAS